jgi:hypothetical protein
MSAQENFFSLHKVAAKPSSICICKHVLTVHVTAAVCIIHDRYFGLTTWNVLVHILRCFFLVQFDVVCI